MVNVNPEEHLQWHLKTINGEKVYSENLSPNAVYDVPSRDTVYKLNFTNVTTPGFYYIEVDQLGKSYTFKISKSAYKDVFKKVSNYC